MILPARCVVSCIALYACSAHDAVRSEDGSVADGGQGREAGQVSPAPGDARVVPAADGGKTDAGTVRCTPTPRSVTFAPETILEADLEPGEPIRTGNIRRVQLGAHGGSELIVSEPLAGRLHWLTDCESECVVQELGEDLQAPVRAQVVDLDGDGDRDVLVADIGILRASTEKVGRVMLLENDGRDRFATRTLLEGIGRVACAEAADFDGDDDLDIVVCEYGAEDGALLWLSQEASGEFLPHPLREEAGAIHAFPFDAEADGDIDIAVALSERAQEVLLYRNRGTGVFDQEVLFEHPEEAFGLSGIELADLDQDGYTDILVTSGDYFDESFDFELHGLWWLRSDRGRSFTWQPITASLGAYAVRAADMDGDCDLDLVLASMRVDGLAPQASVDEPSLVWLQHDGALGFTPRYIAQAASELITLEITDLGNGPSLWVGSFTQGAATPADRRLQLLRRQ